MNVLQNYLKNRFCILLYLDWEQEKKKRKKKRRDSEEEEEQVEHVPSSLANQFKNIGLSSWTYSSLANQFKNIGPSS